MIMREPLSSPCGPIISSIWPFDILSLVYVLWSVFYWWYLFTKASNSIERSVWYRQRLVQFFWIKPILKKESINFCKSYDNEGTTQLPLRSNHFINPTVWHLVFGLNFITSILLMTSFHKGKAVSVPCDTGNH